MSAPLDEAYNTPAHVDADEHRAALWGSGDLTHVVPPSPVAGEVEDR